MYNNTAQFIDQLRLQLVGLINFDASGIYIVVDVSRNMVSDSIRITHTYPQLKKDAKYAYSSSLYTIPPTPFLMEAFVKEVRCHYLPDSSLIRLVGNCD